MKLRYVIALLIIPAMLLAAPKKAKKVDDWHLVQKSANYWSRYYRLPLDVTYRVLENESGWKADSPKTSYKACEQIGKAGELGPMQEKLKTARAVLEDSTITKWQLLHDIDLNIHGGCKLLSQEYEYWRDHDKTTLKDGTRDWNHVWMMTTCSYNMGRKAAVKWDKPNRYAEKAIRKGTVTKTDTVQGKLRKVKKHK